MNMEKNNLIFWFIKAELIGRAGMISVSLWAKLTLFACFVFCAQACDSMMLLMQKLDGLNERRQTDQNSNSCSTYASNDKEEQENTAVSLV